MRKAIVMTGVAVAAALAAGLLAGRYVLPANQGPQSAAEDKGGPRYWVAPMDPSYRSDRPGKSPMGMDLVPVYEDDSATEAPGAVRISPAVVNNLGVRTAPAERGVLHRRIETVGYVQYDEDRLTQVHPRAEGWIERLAVRAAGEPVREGQVLFELYSRSLVNAQQEYRTAQRSDSGSLLGASRDRLLALGMSGEQIDRLHRTGEVRRRIAVHADVDGVVADLRVREGTYVTPSTEVMSLAGLETVWVIAEVFERQAGWVAPGQQVGIRFSHLPGRTVDGSVDYVYPELDAATRTLRVRIRLDNPGVALRPNMYATVAIHGDETGETVHIPREALIRGGRLDRVVLADGEARFRAVPVSVGIESGDRVQILDGVAAGDSVVVSGQFLIDSESNLEAELLRAGAGTGEGATSPGGPEDGQAGSRAGGVQGAGEVTALHPGDDSLTLAHEPIGALDWPAMTMRFRVAAPALLEGVTAGDRIRFRLVERDGDYIVTSLERLPVEPDGARGDHPDRGGR